MKVLNVRYFAGILVALLVACGGSENDSPPGALTTVETLPSTTVEVVPSTTVEVVPSTTVEVVPSTTVETLPSPDTWSDALVVRELGSVDGAPLATSNTFRRDMEKEPHARS